MEFEKSSPESVQFFTQVAPVAADVEMKKVFSYPACFVNGNMFAGLHGNMMILRLPEPARQRFIETCNAAIFEPMPGRPMKEYVVIPDDVRQDSAALAGWIDEALRYGRTLPPKEKKEAKKKK